MLLQNDAERTLDLLVLEDGEPNIFALVGLRVIEASGSILPCSMEVDRSLDDVSATAPDVGQDRRM